MIYIDEIGIIVNMKRVLDTARVDDTMENMQTKSFVSKHKHITLFISITPTGFTHSGEVYNSRSSLQNSAFSLLSTDRT